MTYQGTAILGATKAQVAQLEGYALRVNPGAPHVAALYLNHGVELGVRADLAYAQALFETNFFRYGGLVSPTQNNYAGIGAVGPGNPGASFATPDDGVLAHLQHLFAYASTDPLPTAMRKVDPRFDLVTRGIAVYVGDLNGRWAVPGSTYGQSIDRILDEMLLEPLAGEPFQVERAYLDTSSPNRPGSCESYGCWERVRGIVVHRTASPTGNAMAIRNYFNTAPDGRHASSQFVLDDTSILQLMPVGEIAYHTVGKNLTHLGIETCEYNWSSSSWPETYHRLVWLVGYLVRMFELDITAVTGHFWWDPVDRPYDPTHLGWNPSEGQPKGLFDWNQFIVDVQAQIHAQIELPKPVDVQVTQVVTHDCTEGLLFNSTTYVPIRAYTACVVPDASITYDPNGPKVVVSLPPAQVGPNGPMALLESSTTPSEAPHESISWLQRIVQWLRVQP